MKKMILIIVAISLSSCVTTTTVETRIVKDICDNILLPLDYDGLLDTQETKDGNKAHNARRDSFCHAGAR